MQLNLITLATVKTQLGISDTTYDASITAMIPIVSNDVRRILNTNFDKIKAANFYSGSAILDVGFDFNMGQVIQATNIPDDTYIQSHDYDTGKYTMSANATDDGTYIYPIVQIGMWPAISKMIFYKIEKQSTTSANTENIKSISYGPVSKTFADSAVNKKYDYPEIFIKELGTAFAKVG